MPHIPQNNTRSVDFYKQHPQPTPALWSASSDRDMIIRRSPVPWTALASIQQTIKAQMERDSNTFFGNTSCQTIQIQGKAKDRRSMQAWQSNLAKRRKVAVSKINLPAEGFSYSMPPSPTSTLCEMDTLTTSFVASRQVSEQSERQTFPLTTTIPRPRLKLEPQKLSTKKNLYAVRGSSNETESPVSIEAAFRSQARKLKEVKNGRVGPLIKGPKQNISSCTSNNRKDQKDTAKRRPASTTESFDWCRWSSCSGMK